jgi:hypothetical protein
VASPPSKIIEYIRRFHLDLYRVLRKGGIVRRPSKDVSELTRFSAPPPF